MKKEKEIVDKILDLEQKKRNTYIMGQIYILRWVLGESSLDFRSHSLKGGEKK